MPAPRRLSRALLPLALGLLLSATGCHSAYITAHVHNLSSQTISLVEVDYPSASFGKDLLGPGATYDYRFKVLGDGQTSVAWTDSHQVTRKSKGPSFKEGDEGTLEVNISATTAAFTFRALSGKK